MTATGGTTGFTTCPLCEASCGLRVSVSDGRVAVRGNPVDVLSQGFLCPKGASLGQLHDDPDRLRRPLVRRDGELVEASWEEAFAEVERRLLPIIEEHGRDAVAVYFGNPTAHQLAASLYLRPFIQALGTTNVYSAGSVDQIPKVFVAGYLYGDPATVPVPDLDRTDHLVVIGADPLVSNGSLMTAPEMPRRIAEIRERGQVVVIDPRRTRTAAAASEHHRIRPGTDALLLAAMLRTILQEGLADLGEAGPHVTGLSELDALVAAYSPERVAPLTGIDADVVRRLARDLAAADRAVVYGRLGTTTQAFGTLTSWLIDVLNVVTGNLDRPGGVMFPLAAAGQPNSRPGRRRAFRHGRWTARISGRPEVMGELPVAGLADEILEPGPGQVRALVTVSGNPALSTPNAGRTQEALGSLDFMLSLDVYLNETTRHADVVLPGPSPLERSHYDLLLFQYAVRNVARYSPAVLDSDVPAEWETLLRLAALVGGRGTDADVDGLDRELSRRFSELNGVPADDHLHGPERLLDILLRAGPYSLTLTDLQGRPEGMDLGELRPRLPGVLATESGLVELAPPAITSDLPRLERLLDRPAEDSLVLLGRRHLRSNNSWMHNIDNLNRAGNDCTAQLHPDDAAHRGLASGERATLVTRVGSLEAVIEVTDDVPPGVVSLPHGWGHQVDGVRMSVATGRPGVNANLLTDHLLVDEPTGTAAVNGGPVEVRANAKEVNLPAGAPAQESSP